MQRILDIKEIYPYTVAAVFVLMPWSILLCSAAIVLMGVVGLFSTSWREKKELLTGSVWALLLMVLYMLYVVGLLYTRDMEEGLFTLEQKLGLLVIPFVITSSRTLSNVEVRRVLYLFVVSNLLFTIALVVINLGMGGPLPDEAVTNFDVYTMSRYLDLHATADQLWLRFSYISLTNMRIGPTYLSIYLIVCIVVLFLHRPSTLPRSILNIIMIGWFSLVIAALASRTGVLLFLLVVLVELARRIMLSRLRGSYAFILLAPAALIGVFTMVSPVTKFRLVDEPTISSLSFPSDSTGWNSLNLRLLEWNAAYNGIKENALLGVGTGGTTVAMSEYFDRYDLGIFRKEYNAHNQYMETYLEIGLAGFLCLLACYGMPLAYSIRNRHPLLLHLSLIVIVASLTTCVLEIQKGLVFYIAFVSILMLSNERINEISDRA